MMKKILTAVLAFAMLATVLGGCDLFTSGDDKGGPDGSEGEIKMTDSYTFTDPEGIKYAKRYVAYGDENSYVVSSYATMGYGVKAMYSVYYADENDAPLGYYDYTVCTSAEEAQNLVSINENVGQILTVTEDDPCVVYMFTDGDAFEGLLTMTQSYGSISDATVSAYVEYYVGMMGYVLQ